MFYLNLAQWNYTITLSRSSSRDSGKKLTKIMTTQTVLFTPYTGMSPMEQSAVVNFLCKHTDNACKAEIQDAVDYAIKNKPSFGGFVMVAKSGEEIISIIVANRTGMEGYNAGHIFVYTTLHREYQQETMFQQHMQKAIDYANGNVAMHVAPNNPALKFFKKLGFKAEFLELRLS